jgi:hypothetical protein
MKRNDSSNLGERQAEGNLGNERNRNSGSGRGDVGNQPGNVERTRESEDRQGSEDWNPSDTHDNNDARRGGSER